MEERFKQILGTRSELSDQKSTVLGTAKVLSRTLHMAELVMTKDSGEVEYMYLPPLEVTIWETCNLASIRNHLAIMCQ